MAYLIVKERLSLEANAGDRSLLLHPSVVMRFAFMCDPQQFDTIAHMLDECDGDAPNHELKSHRIRLSAHAGSQKNRDCNAIRLRFTTEMLHISNERGDRHIERSVVFVDSDSMPLKLPTSQICAVKTR